MKTRNGFVSNSSSSSFIVGWKRPSNEIKSFAEDIKELEDSLQSLMSGLEYSPFAKEIMKSVKEYIQAQVAEQMRECMVFSDYKEFRAEYAYDEDDFDEKYKGTIGKLIGNGWVFTKIYVSNEDGEGVSELLFGMNDGDYVYDNLYIHNEGC